MTLVDSVSVVCIFLYILSCGFKTGILKAPLKKMKVSPLENVSFKL